MQFIEGIEPQKAVAKLISLAPGSAVSSRPELQCMVSCTCPTFVRNLQCSHIFAALHVMGAGWSTWRRWSRR